MITDVVTQWERWFLVGLTTLPLWTGIGLYLRSRYNARRGYGWQYKWPTNPKVKWPPWLASTLFCLLMVLRADPMLIFARNLTLGMGSLIVLITWLAGGFLLWAIYFAPKKGER